MAATGIIAAATVYLLYGTFNFGVWQEWWLALGALIAVIAAMSLKTNRERPST